MSSYARAIKCHECGVEVSGSITEHHKICTKPKTSFGHAIKCHDCGIDVLGSIKEHHKVCINSRFAKAKISDDNKTLDKNAVGDITLLRNTTDVYFIIDVSDSMSGVRLERSKEAILKMVQKMNVKDRIAIITFDDRAFFKLKPRSLEQVLRQNELPGILERIFARGNTALYDAIQLSIDQMYDKNRITILNVLTDGEDNSSKTSVANIKLSLHAYPKIALNFVHIGTELAVYKDLCKQVGAYSACGEDIAFDTYMNMFLNMYNTDDKAPPAYTGNAAAPPPPYDEDYKL